MRPSPLKTTVAILRNITGLTQKEFADLIEKSPKYLQVLELGKQKLPKPLAERIAFETGVSKRWISANDISKPPIDLFHNPYTKEFFEKSRAERMRPSGTKVSDVNWANQRLGVVTESFAVVLSNAYKNGKLDLCYFKIHAALKDLEGEFGIDSALQSHIAERNHEIGIRIDGATRPVLNLQPIAEAFSEYLAKVNQSKKAKK